VASPKTILWEVDVQADFMLPGGRLYVPHAELIVPNVTSLVSAARQGRAFLISSADAHSPADLELREWPSHCLKGTRGAELLPEAIAAPQLVIPNRKGFAFPPDLRSYRQVTIEKNTLDVFDNPNADTLLSCVEAAVVPEAPWEAAFAVFGVAAEYCVRRTVEGLLRRHRTVTIVVDAVRAVNEEEGRTVLGKLSAAGARLTTTEQTIAALEAASWCLFQSST
jgi:nicotinamidase-related amidase